MRKFPLFFSGVLPFLLLTVACDREASKSEPQEKGQAVHDHEGSDHEGHNTPKPDHAAEAHDHDHAAMMLKAEKTIAGASLFHIESTWTNQAGEDTKLSALSGRPVVLAMVYTHCQQACPRIIADMKAISRGLNEEQRKKTRFVLVSIDPERDTVQRLAEFAKQASLPAPEWSLLRGDGGAVRELAAVLGVQYRPEPPSDFAHSNVITILDSRGTIIHRQEGLGMEPEGSVRALAAQLM